MRNTDSSSLWDCAMSIMFRRACATARCDKTRRQWRFTRWSAPETEDVLEYFEQWISGIVERGLLGKLDIIQFKKANPAVNVTLITS